ncbi:hypothetical protein Pd630_LPD04562 [Rhodococcus opacus PD630]|nr:hypothetical protein Pd630_LPD04562 [Rhodococcus opacus PD630]
MSGNETFAPLQPADHEVRQRIPRGSALVEEQPFSSTGTRPGPT